MTAHLEIEALKEGRYAFVLKTEDGRIITRSVAFASEAEALAAARLAEDARLLESRQEEERSPKEQADLRRALKLIREQGRAIVEGRAHSLDHDALFYDEIGLPK